MRKLIFLVVLMVTLVMVMSSDDGMPIMIEADLNFVAARGQVNPDPGKGFLQYKLLQAPLVLEKLTRYSKC